VGMAALVQRDPMRWCGTRYRIIRGLLMIFSLNNNERKKSMMMYRLFRFVMDLVNRLDEFVDIN